MSIKEERVLQISHSSDQSIHYQALGDIKGQCRLFRLRTSPDSNDHALAAHTCYLLNPQVSVSHLHGRREFMRYVLIVVYLVRESLGRRDAPFVHNAGGGRLRQ